MTELHKLEQSPNEALHRIANAPGELSVYASLIMETICFEDPDHFRWKEKEHMSYTIEHVSIRCRNIDTSVEFYKRMFDAKVILKRTPGEGRRIVFLRIGDSMLELMEMGSASEPVDPWPTLECIILE